MTREEAIKIIDCYDIGFYDLSGKKIPADKLVEAFDMAIEALQAKTDGDTISRQAAIRWVKTECNPYGKPTLDFESGKKVIEHLEQMLAAQPKEVIPHRNYKYLSDYWCECGWHLGKKGEVKYCSECGRKVNWDEQIY